MLFSITRRNTLLATAMLLAMPALMAAKDNEVRLRTALSGGALAGLKPSGNADFRAIAAQASARLNVEVEDVNLAAGTKVSVFVDGVQAGSITISAAPVRGGELELNTQDGQSVPSIKAGAVVVVRNGATAILSGVLN